MTDNTTAMPYPQFVSLVTTITNIVGMTGSIYLSDPDNEQGDIDYVDWELATDSGSNRPLLRVVLDRTADTLYLYYQSGYSIPEPIYLSLYGLSVLQDVEIEERMLNESNNKTDTTNSQSAEQSDTLH